MNKKNLVIIAKIGKPVGLYGYSSLLLFGQVDKYELFFENGEEVSIEDLIILNDNKGKIKLSCCNTREEAAEYTNLEIFCDSTCFPALPEDEYYYHELINMDIYYDNQKVAKVINVYNFGAGIILDTDTDRMISLEDSVVDKKNRIIHAKYY